MKPTNCFGVSDRGLCRTENEDAFLVVELWGGSHLLALVVDGMGGLGHGAEAADQCCRILQRHLQSFPACPNQEALQMAFIEANNAIYELRRYTPMGCVATALLLDTKEHTAELCHLGDTRLYYCHNQQLQRLTRDHSVVAALEDTGRITEAEAMAHPRRNEVTRFVGRELLYWGSDYLTYQRLTLSDGVLLLCSDGLYDMVPSNRIEEVLSCTGLSLEERCRLLLADALRAGGKDNITILLLDLD